MTVLLPNGLPAEAQGRVAIRCPVIWTSETEGVARGEHPTSGATVGPFRVLIENHTKCIPPEHKLPFEG